MVNGQWGMRACATVGLFEPSSRGRDRFPALVDAETFHGDSCGLQQRLQAETASRLGEKRRMGISMVLWQYVIVLFPGFGWIGIGF